MKLYNMNEKNIIHTTELKEFIKLKLFQYLPYSEEQMLSKLIDNGNWKEALDLVLSFYHRYYYEIGYRDGFIAGVDSSKKFDAFFDKVKV